MSFVAIAAILATLINAALGGLVLLANPRSSLNRVYALWSASVVAWNLAAFIACLPGTGRDDAVIWLRVLQTAVIFMPVLIVHLSQLVVHGRTAGWLRWFYLLHAGLAASLAGPWFMRDVQFIPVGWWAVAGPLFWVFLASYTALVLPMLIQLPAEAARAPRTLRGRIQALWVALLILGVLGTNDLMPVLGLSYYPGTRIAFIPLGNLAAIFYGAAVGYSVLQHQLLDIRVGLSKVAAHAVRLVFLVLIGLLLLLVVSILAPQGSMTTFAFWTCLAVLLASGIMASLYMPKLLGGGAEALQRRLLGDHFEYQDQVRAFIEQCRWHTELEPLLNGLHTLLINTLGVRAYWLVLLDETNRAFTLVRSHPENSQRQIPELRTDSPAFQIFMHGKQSFLPLRSELPQKVEKIAAEARDQLKSFQGELAFPLIIDQRPLGLLITDSKTRGDAFTKTDIQLLASLTENIVLVINQISLKNQLLQTKELDLLGRMSQGMAHDLNNLTTPVWTLLQLLNEGASAEALRTDLAPVAMRNIKTMREYIKEALFFSENLRPDFREDRLDVLVQEVVDLAKQNKRKGKDIQYSLQLCGNVTAEMDHVLIRRLLTNVIANAVDASKPGDSIRVELIRLVKTDPTRDWFRVRVTDQGAGIKSENLDRIFQPYFTTKKTGDEDRGFGLGLTICRKIAALHGGNLAVSSEVGKGTTVNLDLPSHQKTQKAMQPVALAMSRQ